MKKKSRFYPEKVLEPINNFLKEREAKLQKQKNKIAKEDPFTDESRFLNNTATDAKAAGSFGHARSTAVKSELDKILIRVRKALTNIKLGTYGLCEKCNKMIDTDRLAIDPASSKCVACASGKSSK